MRDPMSIRPAHLPEFKSPPLDEVVLGVQFRPPAEYQQVHAGEVWKLFRDDYPKVQEQMALEPSFETFGPIRNTQPQFNLVHGPSHDRFWFLTPEGFELIQFQPDRLMHNWRKLETAGNEYPRFEAMIEKFERELDHLNEFMVGLSGSQLEINQCELNYINVISLKDVGLTKPAELLRGFDLPNGGPEELAFNFRRTITTPEGKPTGRIYQEAVSGMKVDLDPVLKLTLTVRGAPKTTRVADAIAYLKQGRDLIVTSFAEITSDIAQKSWGRVA